ncbi:MAG: hypothetical protein WC495_00080 [Patescibacteria group bacterium]
MKNFKAQRMRILHAPFNIAGQASIISRAQRKLGHQSDVMILNENNYKYEFDINLNINSLSKISKIGRYSSNFFYCITHYDLFHFHFGNSLLPKNIDLRILKLLNKKIVMHYWGSDVLQTDIALNYTLFDKNLLKKIYPKLNNKKRRQKIKTIESIADATIVGDFSLLPYSPKSHVVRQAISLEKIPRSSADFTSDNTVIVHAPTNRDIKGTSIIISAIKKLQQKYKIQLVLVENKSNAEALKIYQSANIVVNDILQGPYGILAIECMALGKPVLSRIDKKLSQYYDDSPIVNSSPETILRDLEKLILNPELQKKLGSLGRTFIEKNHDSNKIALDIEKIYKKIGAV